jgi:hypothetical protein
MTNDFPTNQLIRNSISAYRNGYLSEDQVLFSLDFAAKLGDGEAQALLDGCRENGVEATLSAIGR